MSVAFAKKIIRRNNTVDSHEKILVAEEYDPFYSDVNLARLQESKQQMDRGQVVTKSWAELENLANG